MCHHGIPKNLPLEVVIIKSNTVVVSTRNMRLFFCGKHQTKALNSVKIDMRGWVDFSWEFLIDYSCSPFHSQLVSAFKRHRKDPIEVVGTDTKLISPWRPLYKLCTCPLSTRRHSSLPLPSVWSLNDNKRGRQEFKQFSKLIFLLGRFTLLLERHS